MTIGRRIQQNALLQLLYVVATIALVQARTARTAGLAFKELKPKRAVVASLGTYGDFFPFGAIGAELIDQGYDVDFLYTGELSRAGESFKERLESAGVTFYCIPSEFALNITDSYKSYQSNVKAVREWWLKHEHSLVDAHHVVEQKLLGPNPPDILVVHIVMGYFSDLAFRFQVPLIMVGPAFVTPRSLFAAPPMAGTPQPQTLTEKLVSAATTLRHFAPFTAEIGEKMSQTRAQLGYGDNARWHDPFNDPWNEHIRVRAAIPGHGAAIAQPPNQFDVGALFPSDKWLEPLSADLSNWLDNNPQAIYYTVGSLETGRRAVLKEVIRGLASLQNEHSGISILVSISAKNQDFVAEELASHLPEGKFRVEIWVSQIRVLRHPSVVAVVATGGNGGLTQSLHFGKPVLVIPNKFDAFDAALSTHESGAGLQLRQSECGSILAAEVSSAMGKILAPDNPIKRRAELLGRWARRGGGVKRVVELADDFIMDPSSIHSNLQLVEVGLNASDVLVLVFPLIAALMCCAYCCGHRYGRKKKVKTE